MIRRTQSKLSSARGAGDDVVDPLYIYRRFMHPDAKEGSSEWAHWGRHFAKEEEDEEEEDKEEEDQKVSEEDEEWVEGRSEKQGKGKGKGKARA